MHYVTNGRPAEKRLVEIGSISSLRLEPAEKIFRASLEPQARALTHWPRSLKCMRWDRSTVSIYGLVHFCPRKNNETVVCWTVSECIFRRDRIWKKTVSWRSDSRSQINIRRRFMVITTQEKLHSKRYYRNFLISLVKWVNSSDPAKFKYI